VTGLYWADPADSTHATIGLDLCALDNGDPFGFQFFGLDWGEIDPEITWQSDGEVPGAEQVRRHPGPVLARIKIHADFRAADFQTQLEAYQLLGRFLEAQDGVLVWYPLGADEPKFWDTYPSPVPPLFRGIDHQGAQVLEGLVDQGYEFNVWHHPYPRRAAVTLLDGVEVSNLVGDNVLTYDNPGSALSEARLEIEVPGGEDVMQFRVGFRTGDSDEFAADLSGYAINSPAQVREFWRPIHRQVLTPADPAAFAGTYRVVVNAKLDEDVYHLRLFSGATLDEDQPLSNDGQEVELDATDLSNFDPFTEIDLGLVTYDASSPSLVLEIQAYSEGDTDMGEWGWVQLIPARPALVLSSPGYRTGAFGRRIFRGTMLARLGGASLDDDDAVVLDPNAGEIAEVKPVAGQTLPLGYHVLRFRGVVINRDRVKAKIGELRVLKDDVEIRRVGLHSRKGRVQTYYGGHFVREIHFKVDDDSALYRFQVENTSTDDLPTIKVASLIEHYAPAVTEGRRAVIDSGTRTTEIEDEDGARLATLRATGLPWIDPGPGAVAITIGEQASFGYAHVDDRGPLPKVDEDTSALVTLTVTPRDLQA